ncbi:MAG: hypothetical protein ABIP13_08275, partial [Tepidiformaceae bacterium]
MGNVWPAYMPRWTRQPATFGQETGRESPTPFLGKGATLASLPPPNLSHIELYPRLPGARDYLDQLGRGRKLIRVDLRSRNNEGAKRYLKEAKALGPGEQIKE